MIKRIAIFYLQTDAETPLYLDNLVNVLSTLSAK